METCSAVLTFESVDETLWCDYSNETSSAVLLHGTICFSLFYKMKFGIFLKFSYLALLGVKGLINISVTSTYSSERHFATMLWILTKASIYNY